MKTNSWVARAKKFLIAAGTFLVVGANAWAEGPDWLYPVAAGAGAVLVYVVGNAPEFSDPRKRSVEITKY